MQTFQLDDSKSWHGKWIFQQTSIHFKLKTGVPGSGSNHWFWFVSSPNIPASSMKISTSSTVLGSWRGPVTCHQVQSQSVDQVTPPKNERMSPEKGPFQNESSSSNHQFSRNILVFKRGIGKLIKQSKWVKFCRRLASTFYTATCTPLWVPKHVGQ